MSLLDGVRPPKKKVPTESQVGEYQRSLFAYNESLVSKDESAFQYRQIVVPFQLVVESEPADFGEGLSEGMKKAKEKMAEAVSNYMRAQILGKEWPIDTFANHRGKLCYGITLYLLTDGEMHQLEERLHNGLDGDSSPDSSPGFPSTRD